MSGHTATQKVLRQLGKEGWVWTMMGNGHYRLTHPDAYRPITVSGTISSQNAIKQIHADARRALRPPATG